MKNIKTFVVALIGIVAVSCNDYLDVNNNPNDAVTSTPEFTLTAALNATASRLAHNEIGAFWSGQWSPSGSVSGFVPEKTYDITTSFRTGIWNTIYDNLVDYQYVIDKAKAEKKSAVAGMALTMKAFNYQILVDAYGNVPYTNALKGTTVIRPEYDDASVVYDSIANVLDQARAYLRVPISGTNPDPGAADIFLGGDTDTWLQFANTLKLRVLLRQSGVAAKGSVVEAGITELENDAAGFLTTDVTSSPGYQKSAGQMNPFYENYGFTSGNAKAGNRDFYTFTEYFIDQLTTKNDPRISRLAYLPENTAFSDYRGVPFGEGSDEYLYSKISGFGPAFLPTIAGAGSSTLFSRRQPIMLASESYFLQAEAVERGYLSGDSETLYESGITASFTYLGVPSAATAAAAYYNQALEDVSFASSSNKIKAIITQKWIALANINGFEAWTEYRRTGYPDAPLSTRAIGTTVPVRLLYPLSEYSSNTDNVNAQGTISQFTSKIFWDVN